MRASTDPCKKEHNILDRISPGWFNLKTPTKSYHLQIERLTSWGPITSVTLAYALGQLIAHFPKCPPSAGEMLFQQDQFISPFFAVFGIYLTAIAMITTDNSHNTNA